MLVHRSTHPPQTGETQLGTATSFPQCRAEVTWLFNFFAATPALSGIKGDTEPSVEAIEEIFLPNFSKLCVQFLLPISTAIICKINSDEIS